MAKRIFMSGADYLVIAISPALIMALVGSLVFFLIEVMYVGDYQARLIYAFALFVFATVLIARISIEMGYDRAVLFALPLGLAMFLFLLKFVEHPSPFSHVINLLLMGVVWWCAHKLTWDSTVIDDDEDASGEGLMQHLGVDENESEHSASTAAPVAAQDNELIADDSASKPPWWKRFVTKKKKKHTPGVWVLYFSLLALPLFGVGQSWIPVSDVGSRRYAFFLLLVYVAAALTLLVTTSFLNLRRYLRQRRIEMPLSIAGTWVGSGAVIIVLVMMLAILIPRPAAEVAISRVPWQAGSPGDQSPSRMSVLRDGGEEQQDPAKGTPGTTTAQEGVASNEKADGKLSQQSENSQSETENAGEQSSVKGDSNDGRSDGKSGSEQGTGKSGESKAASEKSTSNGSQQEGRQAQSEGRAQSGNQQNESSAEQSRQAVQSAGPKSSSPPLSNPFSQLGGLAGLLKILFYAAIALCIAFLAWKYRHEILRAIADILAQLRQLFGGKATTAGTTADDASSPAARRPTFAEFRDPFARGQQSNLPPEELVRYTFAAFEAWASDRGSTRSPDCTPQEFVGMVVEPQTPMHAEARRLVSLYSQVAYASKRVPREAANDLRALWQLMRGMTTGRGT
jgi:hypothetical protein